MVLSMPSPYKHSKTGVYWFRQRVPTQFSSIATGKTVNVTIAGHTTLAKVGAELKVSLRTKQFDLVWASFTSGPVSLTLRQCVALSGELYRLIGSVFEEEADGAAARQLVARHRWAQEVKRHWKSGPRDALKIGRPRAPASNGARGWMVC